MTGTKVAVIGGGPAGLMAAEVLANGGATVTVYDRMPSVGRKFLLTGRGGLNLTHSEPLENLLARYGAASPMLRSAIEAFPPAALRDWCEKLGQATFVGSSGRVFPTAMKASPLLRSWLGRLQQMGVAFKPRHRWVGWNDNNDLLFDGPDGPVTVACDAAVLALGGASWPRLGSVGDWVAPVATAGIDVATLQPANSGFTVAWSDTFRSKFEGHPLKRIALSFSGKAVRGEAIVTQGGLEGGAIYALSTQLRDGIAASGHVDLHIDLRPDMTIEDLATALDAPRGKQSLATFLRKTIGLAPVGIGLMHEAVIASSQALSLTTPVALASLVKDIPVRLTGTTPIAKAISTAGGISFDALDEHFMLQHKPGVFAAGEMLDWEAPTGGYLLQAAFATGAAAGRGALAWAQANARDRS